MTRAFLAALAAALALAAPAAAFTPGDPYFARQWYLEQDHAFDAWTTPPPTLAPVKIGLVDSGVDCSLPDLQGRILEAKSFVGGDPCTDGEGHGTIVAGEIAGNLDSTGIVGIAYSAQLLIAKVVRADGNIPLDAEAQAIRWTVDQGAQVINLSLGGVRDPGHPGRDTYSPQEASAVAYAYSHGAVVVAAVGNSDEAYATPWPYASYPAALPHVLGVAALTRTGNVPDFSDRDPIYVDIAAPGVDVFSTFPAALTAQRVGCTPQGYTDCGTDEYRHPEGTSFAAPQVAAAAAVLFAVSPLLTNAQVQTLLERSADDVNATNGCRDCTVGRDKYSGWGRLDVARAVQAALGAPLPAVDFAETNDNAGTQAHSLWGASHRLNASLDYWDDPLDVYRVKIGKGERLTVEVTGGWTGAAISLVLWRPGTTTVTDRRSNASSRVAQSVTTGATEKMRYRARTSGWYYVEVKLSAPGAGPYVLRLARTTPKPAKR